MVEHRRTLDLEIAFVIGLGTMIAAGIFSLSGTAVAAIGRSAVVAFVLEAVVAGLTAASYGSARRKPRALGRGGCQSEFASIYAENGGILVIGATRTRRRRRWVFGSTPDRVIELAKREVPPSSSTRARAASTVPSRTTSTPSTAP